MGRRRGRRAAALIPVALLAVTAAAVMAVLLAGGGGSAGESDKSPAVGQRAQRAPDEKAKSETKAKKKTKAPEKAAPIDQAAEPAEPAAPATTIDPARGAQLNQQGYALMQRGDYARAVPLLQEAVTSWPEDSTEIEYAYALYNLGKSLNRSGRADDAIPYLEKRLNWADQQATVQTELDLARKNAGQG